MTAAMLLRCPRCLGGRLFKSIFAMNAACPVCGLVFEREPGYFMGAMYASYGLGIVILIPLFFLLQWLLPHWPGFVIALLASLLYVPLTPLVFRYSRVIWIYFDRWATPSDTSFCQGRSK
jgi:uncharacterized protein (DUF983 family)